MSGEVSVVRTTAETAAVVAAEGELDYDNYPVLAEAIQEVLRTGPAAFVLDLTGLTFVGSIGVRALLSARHGSAALGVPHAVACGVRVARLLERTGTSAQFATHPTLTAALEAVRPASRGGGEEGR